jgi:ABC-type dipeptide/oligopeptide/nickel transport system permease component
MATGKIPARRPRWFWIPIRVLLVTFLLTLLAFALSLLLGILGTVIAAWLRGTRPNMATAYLHFAAPMAAVVAPVVLVWTVVLEVRQYRQSKALAEIERAA